MAVNTDNVHIFGSDKDALWLGAAGTDLSAVTLDSDLKSITGLTDCGWLSDNGLTMSFDDSTSDFKGHQGHATILTYMDDSKTTLTAELLESKLSTVTNYMNATIGKQTTTEAELNVKHFRTIVNLVAVWDTWDTDKPNVHFRYIFPRVSLGERGEISFKAGELQMFPHTLTVLEQYKILTNDPAFLKTA